MIFLMGDTLENARLTADDCGFCWKARDEYVYYWDVTHGEELKLVGRPHELVGIGYHVMAGYGFWERRDLSEVLDHLRLSGGTLIDHTGKTPTWWALDRRVLADYLDGIAAAQFVGRASSTLARWRRNGTGPRATRFARNVFYRKLDLYIWLESRRQLLPSVCRKRRKTPTEVGAK
jgi:hypothetical protein